jgi:hypothetical protein
MLCWQHAVLLFNVGMAQVCEDGQGCQGDPDVNPAWMMKFCYLAKVTLAAAAGTEQLVLLQPPSMRLYFVTLSHSYVSCT